MSFFLGVILFAIGIAVTIALHEWGHMQVARMCGMRVRRYFIGFGPTVWSTSRKHTGAGGHVTEYGLKAVPLGGFCDIAGMTAQDPVTPEEDPHAMWRRPWWQRIAVLSGGVAMNLVVGILLIYIVAVAWGLPNMNADYSPRVHQTQCVPATQNEDGTLSQCAGAGPAAEAGLLSGDVITAVDGTEVEMYPEVIDLIGSAEGDTVELTVDRAGREETIVITPDIVDRRTADGSVVKQPAVGILFERPANTTVEYGPLEAIPGSLAFTGREQRPHRQPQRRQRRAEHRPQPIAHRLPQRRRERPRAQPHRQAGEESAQVQHAFRRRQVQRRGRRDRQGDAREHQRPTTNLIGQMPAEHQRHHHAHHVKREHDGGDGIRQPHLPLVNRVQPRRHRAAEHHPEHAQGQNDPRERGRHPRRAGRSGVARGGAGHGHRFRRRMRPL